MERFKHFGEIIAIIVGAIALFKGLREMYKIYKNYMAIKNERNTKMLALIDSHEDTSIKLDRLLKSAEQINEISKQVNFLNTSQKTILKENKVMWWRANEEGLTVEVSEQTCTFLKLNPERLTGSNWLNQVPKEYHHNIMTEFTDCLKYKRDFDMTFPFVKGDGKEIKLHAWATYGGHDWFGVHRASV